MTSADLIANDIHSHGDIAKITLDSETAAIQMLANMHEDQHQALMRFLDVVLRVTAAESAGVSLPVKTVAGSASLRWVAVAGTMSRYYGRIAASEFNPCGSGINGAKALVIRYPQRTFPDLKDIEPIIAELLIVPLTAGGKAIGTLWLALHDNTSHFCSDDARAVERLASHLPNGATNGNTAA